MGFEDDVRQRIVPIHKNVISGLQQRLKEELGLPFPWSMQADWRDIFQLSKAVERAGSFGALRLDELSSDMADNEDNYRQHPLADSGVEPNEITVQQSDSEDVVAKLRMRLMPTKFTFTLGYATTDVDELLNFYAKWAFLAEKTRLTFNLNYMGVALPIVAKPIPTASISEHEPVGESSGYQIYEFQLELKGYMSNHSDSRDTRITPVYRNVDLTLGTPRAELRTQSESIFVPTFFDPTMDIVLDGTPLAGYPGFKVRREQGTNSNFLEAASSASKGKYVLQKNDDKTVVQISRGDGNATFTITYSSAVDPAAEERSEA